MSKCDSGFGRPPDHTWEPWTAAEEGGLIFYTRGPRTGHLIPFTHTWQERRCAECGIVEKWRDDGRQAVAPPLGVFQP